jgi:K+-sensing histidine kinase KdpD
MSWSGILVDIAPVAVQPFNATLDADRLPTPLQYVLALAAVGLAVAIGLGLEQVIPAANLTLLFVLPVMIVAMAFGWGPSMGAAVAGALAFDFFFTEPKYSLTIDSPADFWSAGLLLVVGAVVSTLAAQIQRRAMEARRAAIQARALQDLAHAVVIGSPQTQILDAAAKSLNQILGAPAAILARRPAAMDLLASAGDANLSAADKSAAGAALELGAPTHGGVYPTDRARFDFWPAELATGEALAIGVDFTRSEDGRPEDAARYIEAVSGYLRAAVRR